MPAKSRFRTSIDGVPAKFPTSRAFILLANLRQALLLNKHGHLLEVLSVGSSVGYRDFSRSNVQSFKRRQASVRSERPDPDAAHSGDDRGRDNGAYCDARAPNAVGAALIHAVGDQHDSKPRRDVAQDEEDAERIVRQETDVPGVMDEPSRRADREIPIG